MNKIKIRHRLFKGMSLIEYAILVAVVGVAILGMSIYIKRAVSGRWKQGMDIFGYGRQYDPSRTGTGGGGPVTPTPTPTPTPSPTPSPTPPPGPTTFVPSGTLPVGTPGTVTVIIPTTTYLTPAEIRRLADAGIVISGRSDYDDPVNRTILEQSTTGYVSDAQRRAIDAVQGSVRARRD